MKSSSVVTVTPAHDARAGVRQYIHLLRCGHTKVLSVAAEVGSEVPCAHCERGSALLKRIRARGMDK